MREHQTVIGQGGSFLAKYSIADGVATVRRALELGVTYFDTSPQCVGSQAVYGEVLKGWGGRYLLATKLGHLATPRGHRSPVALRAQLWENMRTVRRSEVNELQVHCAEFAYWWKDEAEPDELLDTGQSCEFADAPVIQGLREAREQGGCRFLEIITDKADHLAQVLRQLDVDACLLAFDYKVLFRRARQNVMQLAREEGAAYIAGRIFQRGFTEVHPEWQSKPSTWVTPEAHSRPARLYDLDQARAGPCSHRSLVPLKYLPV
jgi:aryl-alcohol dehydrogenase-like predicted oxidoreductase